MDHLAFVFHVCGDYVHDNVGQLGQETVKRIQGWIRSRSLSNLASCSKQFPDALSNRERFRCLLQVEAFFKKNEVFVNPEVCRLAAYNSLLEGEETCLATNRRLDAFYLEQVVPEEFGTFDLESKVSKMKTYIDTVLGPFSEFLDQLPRLMKLTAGATASLPRSKSRPHEKLGLKWSVSPKCEPYLRTMAKYFGYGKLKTVSTEENRVEFVPKNWSTDRSIACEIDGNLPFQLAFDTYAKRRLRKYGINLRDQSWNQELARVGSIDNSISTVDLKNASNTVSYNTVPLLFPFEWFRYLDAVRSRYGRLPDDIGKTIKYEMFSSMGNGSTFAVETLVFAAACKAVGSKRFSVYGDDIIIETELCRDLITLLGFLGFEVNTEKTYIAGPFRESCGSNWYEGVDITPFYLRQSSSARSRLCHNVNGLLSVCMPLGALEARLLQLVVDENLPLVPFNLNSLSGVWIDPHTAYSKKLIRNRRGSPKYKAYCPVVNYDLVNDSRPLFLWHLDKFTEMPQEYTTFIINGRDIGFEEKMVDFQRSRVPVFERKYARKWVHWHPPVVATPLYLYRLSEELLLRKDE